MPEHVLIIARTGWESRWSDEARYRNQDKAGVMHFPGFSGAAIAWLLAHHPGFVGVGVDTLSTDPGATQDFGAHRKLLGAGKYGIENLAGLDALPVRGATVIVAPLKLAGGSGAPARVFADVPR
jgi:kynurenine formamidase